MLPDDASRCGSFFVWLYYIIFLCFYHGFDLFFVPVSSVLLAFVHDVADGFISGWVSMWQRAFEVVCA